MTRHGRHIALLFLIILWCSGTLPAQDVDTRIHTQSRKLKELKSEIEKFRNELEKVKQEEQSLAEQLNTTEKDLSYTRRLVRQMERTLEEKRDSISTMTTQVDQYQHKLDELKVRFAKRAIQIYKQDRYHGLELLLSSASLNQSMIRLKYLRIINESNKKLYHSISATIDSIQSKRQAIEEKIAEQETLLAEKRREEERLQRKQSQRQNLLTEMKSNEKSLAEEIEEREKAARELEKLITKLERERKERSTRITRHRIRRGVDPAKDIASLRGKLPWPARGQIISRFGKNRNPRLNTVTENTGIDIAAPKGTEVVAVLDGLVTTITWMRGYGNMIIIDHGDNYYTVYTHVVDIQISQNNYVESGDIIAYVGDSGSLEGAKLHFEIWGNREKLNPEHWLTDL